MLPSCIYDDVELLLVNSPAIELAHDVISAFGIRSINVVFLSHGQKAIVLECIRVGVIVHGRYSVPDTVQQKFGSVSDFIRS